MHSNDLSVTLAKLMSFCDFFSDGVLYRIPNYQRGFAWQDQQISDFWQDLLNIQEEHFHYTGMITVQKLNKRQYEKWEEDLWYIHKNKKAFHIIDGQQRVTTFIILLNELVQYAESNRLDNIASVQLKDIKSKYLYRTDRTNCSLVFGYEVDNPSFDFLKYRILTNSDEDVCETYYTNNLQAAKTLLEEKIENYCKGDFSKLDSLFTKLTTKMKFIHYQIDSDLDINVAFETMNNRGKRLSTLELLKNRLMYLVELMPSNVANSFEKNRTKTRINKRWMAVYTNLGRNKDNPLDDDEFLRSHWIIYFGYSRTAADSFSNDLLSRHFSVNAIAGKNSNQNVVEETNKEEDGKSTPSTNVIPVKKLTVVDINDYVDSLEVVSKHWFSTNYPDSDFCDYEKEEKKAIERLNRLGINYFRPLIIASFLNSEVTTEQRINLFDAIERFILLEFRMARYMSTKKSSEYYNYAHILKDDNVIDDITRSLNKQFVNDIDSAMETFKADMSSSYNDEREGFYKWNSIKFLLYEYECYLSESKHKPPVKWSDFVEVSDGMVSIEHIFPQSGNDATWSNFKEFDEEAKKRYLHSLGNLLLLSVHINSRMQDSSFSDKKNGTDRYCGYKDGSNSEAEVAEKEDWGPAEIEERG